MRRHEAELAARFDVTRVIELRDILGDPEVTANIYCKSRNLPNTNTQNYSTDLRELLGHPVDTHLEMKYNCTLQDKMDKQVQRGIV